jgi:hypothetical protein
MIVLPAEGDGCAYLFQGFSGLAARRSICGMTTSRGDRHHPDDENPDASSCDKFRRSALSASQGAYQLSTT